MSMESLGLDLAEQEKLRVTHPGQPGYRAAWDKTTGSETPQPSKDSIRDSAINGAGLGDLSEALNRLEERQAGQVASAEELNALSKIRQRITLLIEKSQN